MLTPDQEKRLEFLTQRIARDREEQRILYAIQADVYLTAEEKTAQTAKAESIPEIKEATLADAEPAIK